MGNELGVSTSCRGRRREDLESRMRRDAMPFFNGLGSGWALLRILLLLPLLGLIQAGLDRLKPVCRPL
jgi:hypothetical protein